MNKVVFKNHKPVTLFQLTALDLMRLIAECNAELERRSQEAMQGSTIMIQPSAEDVKKTLQSTVDYLYKINGDVTSEQYKAISQLRQLINECFYPEKQISNQFIYDQLKEVL